MNRADVPLPTLTEVIELAVEPLPLDIALPGGPDSMAIEDLPVDEVMAHLQPRIDAWIDARVRAALSSLLPRWTADLSQALTHELRASLPTLVAQALAEVASARQRRGR